MTYQTDAANAQQQLAAERDEERDAEQAEVDAWWGNGNEDEGDDELPAGVHLRHVDRLQSLTRPRKTRR